MGKETASHRNIFARKSRAKLSRFARNLDSSPIEKSERDIIINPSRRRIIG